MCRIEWFVAGEFTDVSGYNVMQQFRNNIQPPCFATLPLLSRIFLIYQQLSFPSRSFSRRTLFRGRFMKWYFVRFHFSIRLDLLSRGKAGFRRHLIPKVSRNSYSVGNASTGCLKSLTFGYKDIVFKKFFF